MNPPDAHVYRRSERPGPEDRAMGWHLAAAEKLAPRIWESGAFQIGRGELLDSDPVSSNHRSYDHICVSRWS